MKSVQKLKIIIVSIFLSVLIFACNNSKNSSDKKNYKQEKLKKAVKKKPKKAEYIDLTNKGIGPIKSLVFDSKIDKALANKGASIFKQKCTACHKTDKKFIGPALKGLYKKRTPEWIMNMILNPIEMIEKDPIAKQQFIDFNKTIMINQNLTKEEARAIAEYLRTL